MPDKQVEQLSFVDALYTTIDMMATVGSSAHPLSTGGKLFTMAVIILGVGSLLYTFGAGMEFMIEGHLSSAIRRRFMENKIAGLRNHYVICGFGRVGSQIAVAMPFFATALSISHFIPRLCVRSGEDRT